MSSTYNIQIVGLDQMLKAYKEAPDIVEPVLQEAIVKAGALLASHTDSSTTPYKTGNLVRSFNPVDISRLMARWYPRAIYARAVQYGMDPEAGRYVPAIGKRLKNDVGRSGNQKNIGIWPGFEGRHYMEKIRTASIPEIDELFRNALENIKQKLS